MLEKTTLGPTVDSTKCIQCGGCVEVCPEGVYEKGAIKALPTVARPSLCIECGQCVMICPTDAISIPELAPNKLQKLGELPDGEEVANLLRGRRSIRSFRNKNLDSDLLKKIISLASTAPSFHNSQTTEFVVIQNPKTLRLIEEYTTETMRKLVKAYKNVLTRPLFKLMFRKQINAAVSLVPFVEFAVQEQMAGRSIIFHDAPVVIVFHGHKGKMMAKENAQLCIQNALMQLLLWVLVASIVPWSLLLRQETNVY